MEKHVKALLSALRQAVNEAILGSLEVNATLAALSRAGRCPSLAVDVSLEPQKDEAGNEPAGIPQNTEPGELVLTDADEDFLHSLGIVMEPGLEIPSEAH
jgi:hypothetical protein